MAVDKPVQADKNLVVFIAATGSQGKSGGDSRSSTGDRRTSLNHRTTDATEQEARAHVRRKAVRSVRGPDGRTSLPEATFDWGRVRESDRMLDWAGRALLDSD